MMLHMEAWVPTTQTTQYSDKLRWKMATVAVDLDGTLAKSDAGRPFDPNHIGAPVKKMMARVKDLLSHRKNVVLFTARASDPKHIPPVRRWLDKHKLPGVKITNKKTPDIEVIYDDRAKGVHKNKGTIKSGAEKATPAPNQRYTLSIGPHSNLREDEWVAMLQKIEKHTGEKLDDVPIYANRIGYLDKTKRIARRSGVIGKLFSPLTALIETVPTDFYAPASGSVSLKHPSYPILAHEVGHWLDFERNKGVYNKDKRKTPMEINGPTGIDMLDAELNASLFARKAGLSRQQKEQLNAALGTYLLGNHMRILSDGFGFLDSFTYNHKKDPRNIWKQDVDWPTKLQQALEAQKQTDVRNAMRTALVTELNLSAKQRSVKSDWKTMFKPVVKIDKRGKMTWKREDLAVYPLLAKTLLELEDARAKGAHGSKNKGTTKSGGYVDGGGNTFGHPFSDALVNGFNKYVSYPINRLLGNQSYLLAHGTSELGINQLGRGRYLPNVFNFKWLPRSLGVWRFGRLGNQLKTEGAKQTSTLLSMACNKGGCATPETYERLLGHPLKRVVMNPDNLSFPFSISPTATSIMKYLAPPNVRGNIGPLHTFTKNDGTWMDQGPYRRFDALALGGLAAGAGAYYLSKKPETEKASPPVLPKIASLPGVELKPHQERVVNRITQPDTTGLLAQHGLGSGKTLSSIAAWDALGRPNTAVVVPAALQENYRKELAKWVGEVPSNINIVSQQRLARQGELPGIPPELMIVDEQHKAREQNSALRAALSTIKAKKKLLLTGTPIYNHPHDIASAINLAAGKTMLPVDRTAFNARYVDTQIVRPPLLQRLMGVKPGTRQVLKNRGELGRILKRYVDFHPNSEKGFPSSTEETVRVPMAAGQTDIYNTIMGKAPLWVRLKVRSGLPPGKGEFEAMRAFLTGARQVSNTSKEFTKGQEEAAKIDAAFRFFRQKTKANPDYKAVVYSNYLRSGLQPYKDKLTSAGIPYGEFSGTMDRKLRDDMVRQYNANKLRALLISSAGAEGLDLKGTRLIQLLEPHFNEEKEKQIIGRGIRYGSHTALPPDQQHVLVQRYLAQPRSGWFDRLFGKETTRGADEYIRNLATQKSLLNDQVRELLTR